MIVGKKVDLVALDTKYIDHYIRWINDPEVTDLLGDARAPYSKAREREWIESVLSSHGDGRVFTILSKKKEPIGTISFNHLDFRNGHGVLGIMIGEKWLWDKGYGSDAIKTLLRFGFEELGLRKIELYLNPENSRAHACYKKCGFVDEGSKREHMFYNGRYVDDLQMGILRDEWLKLEKKD